MISTKVGRLMRQFTGWKGKQARPAATYRADRRNAARALIRAAAMSKGRR